MENNKKLERIKKRHDKRMQKYKSRMLRLLLCIAVAEVFTYLDTRKYKSE